MKQTIVKHSIFSFALLAAVLCGPATFGAQGGGQSRALKPALHKILENARLVHEYAAIYDWDNVNLEVDRIVAAEHKAQKALAQTPDLKDQSEALRKAVRELRAARLQQDADRAVAAADNVEAISQTLFNK